MPLRAVFTQLGVQNDDQHIIWNEVERSATMLKDSTKIYVKEGSTTAYVNDQPVALEEAPFIQAESGGAYIPASFIEQSLGKKVTQDDAAKSVFITTTNKEKAVAVLQSLGGGNPEAIEKWISPDTYIQHNLAFPSGRETILNLVKQFKPNPGSAKTNTTGIRVISDGDYVAVQSSVYLFKPTAVFDIFRFDNGKIVEHWDNAQEQTGPNPSGHSMVDGATEIADLDKTEANKALVQSFVKDVLMGQAPDKISSYIDVENYIQHNPSIGDGLSGLTNAFAEMAKQGVSIKYDKVHMVIGEGNFVLIVSEGSFADKPTAFYDLFRVAGDKLVEHWDVLETIPPESEWKNRNGKF
ncbi:nuclear transport factor 2 family protein [Paenibacillus sp. P25]|nr:nuclear transport factor 2 family protein [Paenibacillus sp. P25]